MQSQSTRWTFDGLDMIKTLRTLGVLILGTVCAYLLQSVVPSLQATPLTVTIITTILEGLRRWATNYQ